MAKYMFLYHGPATPTENMSEDDMKAVMAKWVEWMEKLGPAMIDMGTPLGNGAAVVDDGSAGSASEMSGYSIVEAADMAAAKQHAKDHPFLSAKSGKFKIEIHEMQPIPGM